MAKGGVDLLILDIMLPGLDGFEVLRQLRARGDDTPVLVLSARAAPTATASAASSCRPTTT